MTAPQERSEYASTGYQMIRSISIKNYRCFRDLKVDRIPRLTVIVGDNGTGKTSFLEAIFLALGSSLSMPLRYRAQRGLEVNFNAPIRRVEEAIWGDLFHKYDLTVPIQVELKGDGAENRSVLIGREPSGARPGSILVKYRSSDGVDRVFFPDISKGIDDYCHCAKTDLWLEEHLLAEMKLRCLMAAGHKPDPFISIANLWDKAPNLGNNILDSVDVKRYFAPYGTRTPDTC